MRHRAVVQLNAAVEARGDQGEDAAFPGVREAARTTRRWLDLTGASTDETNARIDAILATCASTPFGTCDSSSIHIAALDLQLLLDIGSSPTPLHRANEARLRGFRALAAIVPASQAAPSDGLHFFPLSSMSAAASKAAEAEQAFSEAIDEFVAEQQAPDFKGWNRGEFTTLLSTVSRAAESAYLAGNCGRAVGHANGLINLAENRPQEWQLDYPPEAHALAVKAACKIWYRSPLEAYRFAEQAIALEEVLPFDRNDRIESLEIRARFRASAQLETDPREVGAIAALLLVHLSEPIDGAPTTRELVDNLVKWTSAPRASALSDAILLAALANDGPVAQRSAVDALISANTEVDRARRALAANRTGAAEQLRAAAQRLQSAADVARGAGVRLPEPGATIPEIAQVLRPEEGFLFLYRSQFGPILWGVTADRDVIVAPPTLSQTTLYVPKENPALSSQDVLQLVPPALELSRPSIGWGVRGVNWFLSRPESPQDEGILASALKQAASEFGPSLESIKGSARYWTVAYSEELDGFPIAQLPLLSEREVADLLWRNSLRVPGEESRAPVFDATQTFGYEFAYAIIPSPRALVVLRTQTKAEDGPMPLSYLGVGDIPFRYQPCSFIANASDAIIGSGINLSDAILNRSCLAESRSQLAALRPDTGGVQLIGPEAREAALQGFRDRRVERLVFSTHGIEPEASVTGGWPALLLNPPAMIITSRDDGILTPLEAADLKLRAELVVLSACSTGFEDRALGEEPLAGLAFGFFLGGARSVILTRWQLRVDIGLAFNRQFGEALDDGMTRAEAMRSARRRLIAMGSVAPWEWAVFELVGEAGPMR